MRSRSIPDPTPTTQQEPPWRTTAEVARELRVSPRTVRRWIRAGVLPAARVRRHYLVRRVDVEDLLVRVGVVDGDAGGTP